MSPELQHLFIQINSKGLSFFPLSQLNAVSVYTADYYENYDYDIVLPGQRDKLVSILKQFNFKQTSGRIIASEDKSIIFEFPKPNFTLGDDPAEKTARLIKKSSSLVVITPTQAVLIYLKQFYDQFKQQLGADTEPYLISELTDLLYEQPANLDKVREWLGPSGKTDLFISLKQQFRLAQQKGIDHRREYKFKSLISERIKQL